jgi:peptidoglycan-associated lipoprotein
MPAQVLLQPVKLKKIHAQNFLLTHNKHEEFVMHTNTVLKLGIAALLSVTMAACSSNDTDASAGTETVSTPSATTQAAPRNQPTAEEMEAERQRNITVFYFEFDRSDLSAEARTSLVAHANFLKANPGVRYRLEGHADERGTREYNLALGERRAQAVERYLQVQGVSASQLETISYGEERPAVQGTTEAAYSRNRRVEIVR